MATTIHLTSGDKIRVEDDIDVVLAKLAGPDDWIRLEETGGQPTVVRPDNVTHLTTTGRR